MTGICLALIKFADAKDRVTREGASVADAWSAFQETIKNPYIPGSRIASLKVDLRLLIERHATQLAFLEQSNKELFSSIREFADEFDKGTLTAGAVSPAVGPVFSREGGRDRIRAPPRKRSVALEAADGIGVTDHQLQVQSVLQELRNLNQSRNGVRLHVSLAEIKEDAIRETFLFAATACPSRRVDGGYLLLHRLHFAHIQRTRMAFSCTFFAAV